MEFLPRLKGITVRDKPRSEDERNLLEVNKMTYDIKEYKENCKNHVRRMSECTLPKRVFKFRPPGKR
jgi:hypothetical protein